MGLEGGDVSKEGESCCREQVGFVVLCTSFIDHCADI